MQRRLWKHVLILFALCGLLAACQPKAPEIHVTPPLPPAEAGPKWWDDRVFYEVFVRSFQDSDGDGIGDLEGLISRLDYLNDGDPKTTDDLGVTGLWLMPVTESPSYHGYDVSDYYAIEKDYGDNETFKLLMDEAHKRGMVVIVDLVINHTSNQHPWFQEARNPDSDYTDWYVWSDTKLTYRGPWGQTVWYKRDDRYYYAAFWDGMPDLNFRTPAVTEQIYDVTRFWLTEMGADGFRMDAIRHLIEDGEIQENTPETHQWLADYHNFYTSINPHALTVGEVWTRSEDVVPYVGDELDICFEFDLASAIISAVKGGTPFTLASVVQKIHKIYPDDQYATFLTNHDHNRAMTQLGDKEGRAKMAASIYMTLPGVPFIYYGEEIGITGTKPDENLRTPMQWTAESGTGFSSGQPWHGVNTDYKTRNVEVQAADSDSLLQTYKDLIRLRSSLSALRTGELINVTSSARSVFAYLRHDEDATLLVVHNLADEVVSEYDLKVRASPLAAGSYRVSDLLSDFKGVDLGVGEKGIFEAYAPLEQLEPMTSYVFMLQTK